jgi:hypothetical protein
VVDRERAAWGHIHVDSIAVVDTLAR